MSTELCWRWQNRSIGALNRIKLNVQYFSYSEWNSLECLWHLKRKEMSSYNLKEIVYLCMEMDVAENLFAEDARIIGWFLRKKLFSEPTKTCWITETIAMDSATLYVLQMRSLYWSKIGMMGVQKEMTEKEDWSCDATSEDAERGSLFCVRSLWYVLILTVQYVPTSEYLMMGSRICVSGSFELQYVTQTQGTLAITIT